MTAQEPTQQAKAGVDRSLADSTLEKVSFFGLHILAVAVSAWLLWGGGAAWVGRLLGQTWTLSDPMRGALVFGAAVLYLLRHGVTLFYLLKRKVTWSEAMGLSSFFLLMVPGFCLLGMGVTRGGAMPFGLLDGLAIGFVLVGSFLNTFSELQRHWWKADPANRGKCYTQGLFRASMHINFFGDSVMFTGWALLTGSWWALVVPGFMTVMFIFFHIPGLDAYLAERYGDDFRAYAKRTKKFAPWIY